jgi:hypothetical protein
MAHQFEGNTFSYLASKRGAAITLQLDRQDATLVDNQFSFLFVEDYGSAVNVDGLSSNTTIYISDVSI